MHPVVIIFLLNIITIRILCLQLSYKSEFDKIEDVCYLLLSTNINICDVPLYHTATD